MAAPPISAATCARDSVRLWWPICTPGCWRNVVNFPERTTWQKPWTTCCGAGRCLPGSSKTAASALTNNAAERALRGIALGRKSWLFAGSDRGGQRAAVMYSLIVSAKMNDVDPQAWLAYVLANIAKHPASRLDVLLPWNWRQLEPPARQAA